MVLSGLVVHVIVGGGSELTASLAVSRIRAWTVDSILSRLSAGMGWWISGSRRGLRVLWPRRMAISRGVRECERGEVLRVPKCIIVRCVVDQLCKRDQGRNLRQAPSWISLCRNEGGALLWAAWWRAVKPLAWWAEEAVASVTVSVWFLRVKNGCEVGIYGIV